MQLKVKVKKIKCKNGSLKIKSKNRCVKKLTFHLHTANSDIR